MQKSLPPARIYYRATHAIVDILRALKRNKGVKRVLIPAIVCPSVIFAARFSSLDIFLVDIDLKNGCLNYKQIPNDFLNNETALVFVELFGYTAISEEVQKFCNLNSIHLLIDAAQSNFFAKRRFNKFETIIFSFGKKKQIEIGFGSIVFSNVFSNAETNICKKPSSYHKSFFSRFYQNLYYAHKSIDNKILAQFLGTKMHLLYKTDVVQPPMKAELKDYLKKISDENIFEQNRKINLNEYLSEFSGLKNLNIITKNQNEIYWRFSFLVDGRETQQNILQALRNEEIHASAWYPCLEKYVYDNEILGSGIKNSQIFESGIVNLWLTDDSGIKCNPKLAKSIIEEYV